MIKIRSIVFYVLYIGSFAICQDQGLDNFNSERFLEAQNYYDSILLEDSNNPKAHYCLLYTSPSPRDVEESRMPSSA